MLLGTVTFQWIDFSTSAHRDKTGTRHTRYDSKASDRYADAGAHSGTKSWSNKSIWRSPGFATSAHCSDCVTSVAGVSVRASSGNATVCTVVLLQYDQYSGTDRIPESDQGGSAAGEREKRRFERFLNCLAQSLIDNSSQAQAATCHNFAGSANVRRRHMELANAPTHDASSYRVLSTPQWLLPVLHLLVPTNASCTSCANIARPHQLQLARSSYLGPDEMATDPSYSIKTLNGHRLAFLGGGPGGGR